MLPIITALLPVLSSVLDRVIPDTAEAAKAKVEMEMRLIESANQAALAQVEVNKAEAASGSVFVGGWRPFIGWVCGAALAYQFIVSPLALWGCQRGDNCQVEIHAHFRAGIQAGKNPFHLWGRGSGRLILVNHFVLADE